MEEVSITIAFLAGLLSFLSPCILPLVPAYLSYITGSSASEQDRTFVFVRAVGFVIGFSIIFILLGASASYLGQLFARYRRLLTRISGIIIILFGLHILGVFEIKLLYREFRANKPQEVTSWFGSMLVGISFATGWTPCVGPVLASILLYAGTSQTIGMGVLLLGSYSLGLGIPFLLAAVMVDKFATSSTRFNKYLPLIERISGIILIIFGFIIYLDLLGRWAGLFY
ncbi:cytochrome c biogenesis protein CcdA [Natroniella sulfidigena]|uniref:cytochrome c biogenesis CcdA family protein n=1 Tax=Natroniella sulfidigena TaxID=723921 RepID=UPI00200B238B|nr:cytochrome c biogenesis protein CcdA [Natroniella sulfidigena]MCK8816815.1 cytochrome c biogenesis protein CcdA [Natroniella sulfidigena]